MGMLLDSTVLIDCLRGRPAGARILEMAREGERLFSTPINVEEIVRSLLPAETESARSLFAGLLMLSIGPEHGWQAGEWRREFASRGVTLSQADCLIAAAAYRSGAVLATGNPGHFPIPGLSVEHWPVGE